MASFDDSSTIDLEMNPMQLHKIRRDFTMDKITETGRGETHIEGIADQFEIWCKMNRVHSDSIFAARYLTNATRSKRRYLFTTGFLRRTYEFETNVADKTVSFDVDYMNNWTYVWNFLVENATRAPTNFQRVSPLLNACVTIFFDTRLLVAVTILSLYCAACNLGISFKYGKDSWYYIPNVFTQLTLLVLVWQGYFVMRGLKPVFVANKVYRRDPLLDSELTIRSAFALIVKYVLGKLEYITLESDTLHRKVRKSGDFRTEGFLEMCCAATEFLFSVSSRAEYRSATAGKSGHDIRASGIAVSVDQHGDSISAGHDIVIAMPSFPTFRPRRYTNLLLLIGLILVPAFFIFNNFFTAFIILHSTAAPNGQGTNGSSPLWNYVPEISHESFQAYAYLTVWYIIPHLCLCWLVVSMSVIISALVFGSDLANGLAVNWKLRFLPLRRTRESITLINKDNTEPEENSELENPPHRVSGNSSRFKTPDDHDPVLDSSSRPSLLGPQFQTFQNLLKSDALNAEQRKLMNTISSKYGIDSDEMRRAYSLSNRDSLLHGHSIDVTWLNLVDDMYRDATERYLFMQHFFGLCSDVWSPFIGTSLSVCMITFAVNYAFLIYIYFQTPTISVVPMILAVFSFVLVCLILVAVAHANSAADTIAKSFIEAGKDDFIILGGQQAWKDYVTSSPVQWTVFGFSVTYKILVQYAVYLLSLIISSGFIGYISNSKSSTDKGE